MENVENRMEKAGMEEAEELEMNARMVEGVGDVDRSVCR